LASSTRAAWWNGFMRTYKWGHMHLCLQDIPLHAIEMESLAQDKHGVV
jgi:hypothetical protein